MRSLNDATDSKRKAGNSFFCMMFKSKFRALFLVGLVAVLGTASMGQQAAFAVLKPGRKPVYISQFIPALLWPGHSEKKYFKVVILYEYLL